MNYLHNMITDGLAFGIPLFIMAVGAIYSEKNGITNLAIEGFQGFGAFCGAVLATILALYAGLSTQTILYIALAIFPSVDFPAPLGPIRTWISPGRMVKLI